MVGDVLQILTTVNQRQSGAASAGVVLRVPALEGVGCPVRDIVVIVAEHSQDTADDLDDEIRDSLGHKSAIAVLEIEDNLVEESTRSAHDVADVVKANHAALVPGQGAIGEFGAGVLEWHVTIEGWVR